MMTRRKKKLRMSAAALLLSAAVVTASGCGAQSTADSDSKEQASDSTEASASGQEQTAVTEDMINIKKGDYETDWEEEDPVTIKADGSSASIDGTGVSAADGVIKITDEGTYVLTGNFNGTVTVDTNDEDAKVRLVLDGFTITSEDGPAVLALTSDKVTITTAEDTDNSISDSSNCTNSDYDAALYSKTDLVMNGSGSLTINGNKKDAVHSTDDLRITGGTYTVTAVDDGLVGKDRLEITDGTFTITTSSAHGDALKSTNTEDEDKGFIYIAGGNYRITSGDEALQSAAGLLVTDGTFAISADGKGFHADTSLEFDGGNVAIDASYEGLEAPVITINDGTFDITASDDGINAAGGEKEDSEEESGTGDGPGNRAMRGMESSSTGYLTINGGSIHINASGDGIDSNTAITQTGGTITVDGPTSNMDGALDYDETYQMSGGSLFAVGSSGMLQSVSDSSSVCCLTVLYSDRQSAGSTITIQSADGSTVAEFTPEKEYESFVFASEDLKDGSTYTVLSNGTTLCSVTLDGTVTTVDDSGNAASAGRWGGFGGGGMRDRGMRGTRET